MLFHLKWKRFCNIVLFFFLTFFTCVHEPVCDISENPRRLDLVIFGERVQQLFLFHPVLLHVVSVQFR